MIFIVKNEPLNADKILELHTPKMQQFLLGNIRKEEKQKAIKRFNYLLNF